jgi:hypothetical protein
MNFVLFKEDFRERGADELWDAILEKLDPPVDRDTQDGIRAIKIKIDEIHPVEFLY